MYQTIDLYDADGRAIWQVHPNAGEQVDVVAMPIAPVPDDPMDAMAPLCRPIDTLEFTSLESYVGSELFVVGYPRNLHLIGTPLWKRATLATEPGLFADTQDLRQQYIDCASREGMSGSPVILRHQGLHNLASNPGESRIGSAVDFFGIYSGRLVDHEEDPNLDDRLAAQIGIVWPRPLVETIVQKGVRDRFRRDGQFEKSIEQKSPRPA